MNRLQSAKQRETTLTSGSFLSMHSSIKSVLRRGADHCLTLPARPEATRAVLERAVQRPQHARAMLAAEAAEAALDPAGEPVMMGAIVGSHPSMQSLRAKVVQAARSRATVLITGETGTGKELVAAALHQHRRLPPRPLARPASPAASEPAPQPAQPSQPTAQCRSRMPQPPRLRPRPLLPRL